jgi:hypothetical protein
LDFKDKTGFHNVLGISANRDSVKFYFIYTQNGVDRKPDYSLSGIVNLFPDAMEISQYKHSRTLHDINGKLKCDEHVDILIGILRECFRF